MKYLAVKNFDKFQHYRDRAPPWIKLYNSLLDDYEYVALVEGARSQLVGMWLLASRHDNAVPYDVGYLREALHVKRLYIDELVAGGFVLALTEKPASKPLAPDASSALAERYHDASPRARPRARERESRGREREEGEENAPPSDASPTANGKQPETWQARKAREATETADIPRLKAIVADNGGTPQTFPTEKWQLFSSSQRDVIRSRGGLAAVWNS